MTLPAMKYLEGNRKNTQIKFGGLNHTLGAKDGELWDMKNLTGDHYPVLATREPRTKLKEMEVSGGILHWNKLCWVDSTNFYYDGERKYDDLSEGKKTLAAIGPYIVIFPDKWCYNIDEDEGYQMESHWVGDELKFERWDADGLWESHDVIQSVPAVDWNEFFKEGDAVTISGCTTRKENNLTAVIRYIDRDTLCFDRDIFTIAEEMEYTEQGRLSISRTVPDLDYICENDNRLWGCKGNRIFASQLGDPFNWNTRDGLETDGWDVDTGSAGNFTGCVSFQGYPIFFKEDHIYKVYGSLPSEYQLVDVVAPGVMTGCGRSLAVANGILFYLSRNGVMAYSGGSPQSVASAFGMQRFKSGIAGSDGMKYYISMCDSCDQWGLYVYDTRLGRWFKEDDTCAAGFSYDAGLLYMLKTDGDLVSIGDFGNCEDNINPGELPQKEGPVEWFAEFADFTEEDPNKKGICKIQLRLELDAGAMAQVYMMFDSDGAWHKVGGELGQDVKRSYTLPIVPRRADHYRLKIEGTGGCRIYSLTVETYSGSEFRSKKGD